MRWQATACAWCALIPTDSPAPVLRLHDSPATFLTPRSGNTVRRNLVLGTVKEMNATSSFDKRMPASFAFGVAENYVEGNVAAGSERYGFAVSGLPCSVTAAFKGSFTNNVAHSNLAGLWLRASTASAADGCTLLANFTTYMNWDFGIIRWAMCADGAWGQIIGAGCSHSGGSLAWCDCHMQ